MERPLQPNKVNTGQYPVAKKKKNRNSKLSIYHTKIFLKMLCPVPVSSGDEGWLSFISYSIRIDVSHLDSYPN